eukprot:jgi/Chlat1/2156/Chrsp17S02847
MGGSPRLSGAQQRAGGQGGSGASQRRHRCQTSPSRLQVALANDVGSSSRQSQKLARDAAARTLLQLVQQTHEQLDQVLKGKRRSYRYWMLHKQLQTHAWTA